MNMLGSQNLRKHVFCQKLTYFKRIMRNRFDNPRSICSIGLSKASKLDFIILKSLKISVLILEKNTISLFVDVALLAASILKNHDLLSLFNFLHVAKLLCLLGFEPREYARSVSFEECCRMQ